MAKSDIDPNTVNRIVHGTEITGDIISEGNFLIDGKLTGKIQTKGKIVIGKTGFVKGEITCKSCDVSGTIEGKLTVNEQLSLKSSSKITGDIITDQLAIEPGSVFSGTCGMKNRNSSTTSASKPAENVTEKSQ